MTFEEFTRGVLSLAFPGGEPDYTVAAHRQSIHDALNDLQSVVPCLRRNHVEFVPHCSTYYRCGTSAFQAPDGRILELSVVSSRQPQAGIATPFTNGKLLKTLSLGRIKYDELRKIGVFRVYKTAYEYKLGIRLRFSCILKGAPPFTPGTLTFTGALYHVHPDATLNTHVISRVTSGVRKVPFTAKAGINASSTVELEVPVVMNSAVFMSLDSVLSDVLYGGLEYSVEIDIYGPPYSRNPDMLKIDSEWCGMIRYRYVDPDAMDAFVSFVGRTGDGMTGFCKGLGMPSWVARKLASIPTAPNARGVFNHGYVQATSVPNIDSQAGRALGGIWTVKNNLVVVAPWIQSYETIIIRYEGRKHKWKPDDLLPDDPLLVHAVAMAVVRDHASFYDRNYELAAEAAEQYSEARSVLYYNCVNANRAIDDQRIGDAPSVSSHSYFAIDEVDSVPQLVAGTPTSPIIRIIGGDGEGGELFGNDPYSITLSCHDIGKSGNQTVTVNVEANMFMRPSKELANAAAEEFARLKAAELLNECTGTDECFKNTVRATCTVRCPSITGAPQPVGDPVTVVVEPGEICSDISEDDANQMAKDEACARAAQQLECKYSSSRIEQEVVCQTNPSLQTVIVVDEGEFEETITGPGNLNQDNVKQLQEMLDKKAMDQWNQQAAEYLEQNNCPSKAEYSIWVSQNVQYSGEFRKLCASFRGPAGTHFVSGCCMASGTAFVSVRVFATYGPDGTFETRQKAAAAVEAKLPEIQRMVEAEAQARESLMEQAAQQMCSDITRIGPLIQSATSCSVCQEVGWPRDWCCFKVSVSAPSWNGDIEVK